MPSVLLAIDQFDPFVAAQADQGSQCNFGGIGGVGEHGFAEHSPAESHAIQAAHELAINPSFHAVGVALRMQRFVGGHHVGHDPGPVLPVSRDA